MICILNVNQCDGGFQIRYLERSPQPKVKEIGVAKYRSLLLNRLPIECRGDNALWVDDAIANWLLRN